MKTTEPASASSGMRYPHWIVKTYARLQVLLNRLSGGRLFNSFEGREVCFVTMKGAKSGRTLTMPLMYVPYGDGVLLVASLGEGPAGVDRQAGHPDEDEQRQGEDDEDLAPLAGAVGGGAARGRRHRAHWISALLVEEKDRGPSAARTGIDGWKVVVTVTRTQSPARHGSNWRTPARSKHS